MRSWKTIAAMMLAGAVLAGCAERIVEEQAKGVARKGEARAVSTYVCPDRDQALVELMKAGGATLEATNVENIMKSLAEPCLAELEIYDATDRDTVTAQLFRNAQPVFTLESGGQRVTDAITASVPLGQINAQAALQMAISRNMTIAQVVDILGRLGVSIINPLAAGTPIDTVEALRAWAQTNAPGVLERVPGETPTEPPS